ncbi:MAG: hypothetical protein JWM04_1637 [Verrucomicrobiales bacterium]|nr:hypothetical protein [Verrucomicrobiales bacterium]
MKSSYELAMERLNSKNGPAKKLSAKQKKELAEIDSIYSAKVAEKELLLKKEMEKAMIAGQYEEYEKIEKQLSSERKRLEGEREEKKEIVRNK